MPHSAAMHQPHPIIVQPLIPAPIEARATGCPAKNGVRQHVDLTLGHYGTLCSTLAISPDDAEALAADLLTAARIARSAPEESEDTHL